MFNDVKNIKNYDLMSYKGFSKQLNDRTLSDYFYRLMLISRSLFKWENLPNGLDEKWIERYLFCEGSCLFFKDPNLGFVVTHWGCDGTYNMYDEPTNVVPIAVNYIYEGEQLINNENAVIIRNNDDMLPTSPTIQMYAYKLTNVDRTIDTNIMAMKIPTIIKCSDKQKLSLKQTINQRNDNEPVIYGDKGLDTTEISSLKIDAPIVFDKLQIQKHSIWNECMTFLGINNANMDKRERLVDDEVQANNEQVQACEDVMLKARQKAVEQINEVFGTNIRVTRRKLEKPYLNESEDILKIDDMNNDNERGEE